MQFNMQPEEWKRLFEVSRLLIQVAPGMAGVARWWWARFKQRRTLQPQGFADGDGI